MRSSMKISNKANSIFDRTISSLAALAGILLSFMILAVTYQIVTRYFLGRSPVWVIEISEYILLWITFLSTAWVLRREGHVKMDFVLAQLSPRTQSMINAITSIIGVIVFLLIAWYGTKVTWDHFQLGYFIAKPLRTPSYFVIWVIPAGSFLFSIQFLRKAYDHLKSWRASE